MLSSPPAQEPALRRWGILLLKLGLSALALYLTWRLVARIGWADLAGRMAATDGSLLLLASALLLARNNAWDWRFRLAARRATGDSPGAVTGFFVLFASAALNLLTPSARVIGGLVRARYYARSTSRPFGPLFGVVLYDQVAHHAVLTVCTWITFVVAALAFGRTGWGLGGLAALVAAAGALAALARRESGGSEANPVVRFLARRAARAEGRLQSLYSHGREAAGVFVRLLGDRRLYGGATAAGVLYFALNALAQWAIFLALGRRVSLLAAIAGVTLGHAAGTLSGTPGGVGTTEAGMVASFELMGVGAVDATAATLLFRGLHYAQALAIGLPALAFFELRAGRKAARPADRGEPAREGVSPSPLEGGKGIEGLRG
jgi:uncharacterized protein (TIRG00374 family)